MPIGIKPTLVDTTSRSKSSIERVWIWELGEKECYWERLGNNIGLYNVNGFGFGNCEESSVIDKQCERLGKNIGLYGGVAFSVVSVLFIMFNYLIYRISFLSLIHI